jgi:hypothetical protein
MVATVSWYKKGVQMEFMQQAAIMTPQVHCKTLKELSKVIQNQRLGMLTFSVVLLHDNAIPHTAARTQALLQQVLVLSVQFLFHK